MERLALIAAVSVCSGCAFSPRGFDRGALTRSAHVARQEVTDAEIGRVLALRPQLQFPFRLAVWFRPPRAERWSSARSLSRADFRWRDEDREAVLAALRPLVASGILTEIAAIPDSVVTGDDLRAARLAGARHGADALLVVSGAGDVDRYNNWASVLYVTLVGLWIVPGSHAEGIFLASGSLWDVRNEFLYATAEAEGTSGKTGPAVLLEDEETILGAKRAALAALGKELSVRVRSLREPPGTSRPDPGSGD
jgi:hypothetical protein